MRRLLKGLSFALLLALPLACAEEPVEEPAAEGPVTEPVTDEAAPADTAAVVTVSQMEPYGPYLTDADGRALYLFVADADTTGSTCYGACAEAWPPFLAPQGTPVARGAAMESLLGTIERRDGATQVTYNGWPLYYFAQDQDADQPQGQDVTGFGAEWYLVTPEGTEVHVEGEGSS